MQPVLSNLIVDLRRVQEIYDAALLAGEDAGAVHRAVWVAVGSLQRTHPFTKKVTKIDFNNVPRQQDHRRKRSYAHAYRTKSLDV